MIPPGYTISPTHKPVLDSLQTASAVTIDSSVPANQLSNMPPDDEVARKIAAEAQVDVVVAPEDSVMRPFDATAVAHVNDKVVHFLGFYFVQSPTEPRHVRYGMDVASPELDLQVRCTQRFRNFYLFRKRLLKTLKHCHGHTRTSTSESKSICRRSCEACRGVYKHVKALQFPHRKLFTRAEDIDDRAPVLEAFLEAVVVELGKWTGCPRGRKVTAVVLGKLLGVNLLMHLWCLDMKLADTQHLAAIDNQKEVVEAMASVVVTSSALQRLEDDVEAELEPLPSSVVSSGVTSESEHSHVVEGATV